MAGARAAWTPMTLVCGAACRSQVPIPAISEPFPTGT
jgi:hypothetical protein